MAHVRSTLEALRTQYPALGNGDWIFCLITGKPVAALDGLEVHDLIDSLDGDAEQAADDYAMRLLASSRPSLRWNHLRVADITALRETHPVETLCYLKNGGAGVRIAERDFFGEMLRRIEQFNYLSQCPAHVLAYHYFRFYMAEETALTEQQVAARRMRNWLESTDQIGDASRRAKVIATLEAEAALIREGKIKRAIRPVGERTLKKREHDKKLTMAGAFLDSILNDISQPQSKPAPVPQPATRPAGTGFTIRIPAKEA
jgi:hypothetical protein